MVIGPGRSGGLFSPARWLELARTIRSGQGVGARFARGSVSSIAVNVAGAGIAFGVQVLLARAMGASEYGGYLYILGLMNWASLVARFQLDTCASRYVSEYRATGQAGLLRSFIRYSQRRVGVHSLVLAVAFLAVIAVTGWTPPALLSAMIAGVALLPANSLLVLTCSSLEGLQRVVESQSTNFVLRPALLGLFALVVVLGPGRSLTAAQGVWLNLIAACIALVVAWMLLRRALGPRPPQPAEPPRPKEWMHTAVGFWWVAVAQQMLTPQTDVLVVGFLLTKDLSGIYGAASQLATLVGFGVNAVGAIGMPMIAQLYAQRRPDDLQRLVKHYGRINLAVSLPVFVLVAVIGARLLRVYGDEFDAAYPVLLILGLTQVVSAAVGVQAGYLLTMTGRERAAGRIVGMSALTNLGLTVILTPTLGIAGTALATLLATLSRSVLLARHIRRELGINVLGIAAPRGR